MKSHKRKLEAVEKTQFFRDKVLLCLEQIFSKLQKRNEVLGKKRSGLIEIEGNK